MRRLQRYAWLAAIVLLASTASAIQSQTGALDSQTENALQQALDDERHAQALYQAVMDRHGSVRPFSNIIKAEKRHESFLLDLFRKYEIEIPQNFWSERTLEVPATPREACAQAVEAEKANVEMYDVFLEFVEEPEIREVLTRLRDASEERHLPAFERCSDGRGRGRGRGRSMGAR